MDGDLAESVSALKAIFEERFIPANFGKAEASLVERLRAKLKISERYAAFLAAANPVDVETATPAERVRFIPAEELEAEQLGYSVGDGETQPMTGWRTDWIVIAHSAMLGDPYFLDTSRVDVEGDCPVMTAMSGTDTLKPVLCASSFERFVRILATGMQVATGFAEQSFDDQDEALFREAMVSKLRVIDTAALRGGHWT